MSLLELFLLALSLSLDAAVVAVGAGALARLRGGKMLLIALLFGGAHALMPILGWQLGLAFKDSLLIYSNLIGAGLLALVGLKMLYEAGQPEDKKNERDILRPRTMLLLALATSIDTLAIGFSFTFLPVEPFAASCFIGIVTFVMSYLGFYLGKRSHHLIGTKVELLGAVVLLVLAAKIFLS